MIRYVACTDNRFQTIEFKNGMNIVLAERTKESTRTDSCNGLGKSTLIDIIQFLLGSSTKSAKPLLVSELADWTFSSELSFGHRTLTVSRAIARPSKVLVNGDLPDGYANGLMSLVEYTDLLGELVFDLSNSEDAEFSPSFRSLISYFVRDGLGAYLNPFETFAKMKSYPKQLNNSFLLGLDWQIASAFEVLGKRTSVIDQIRKEAKAGTLFGIDRKLSELEVAKLRLERTLKQQEIELKDFKVHPQYKQIEQEASLLTSEIHELSNLNFQDRRIISLYQKSMDEEQEASTHQLEQMYKEAGFVFSEQVKKSLEEVSDFHKKVATNRRTYLVQELARLNRSISKRSLKIEELDSIRAELLLILRSHGALDEYTSLQQRYLESAGQLDSLTRQIETLKKIELGKASIDADKGVLKQKAVNSLVEHGEQKKDAILAFDSYVRELYNTPGNLIIRIGKDGYEFNTEIERKGSTGIDFMTVFCYDMMLSQLWRLRNSGPEFLVHDSIIFDGVDPRQKAKAIELAAHESNFFGFQYICTLNADELPFEDFSDTFDVNEYVRLRLTDKSDSGSILGLRINNKDSAQTDVDHF